MAVDHFHEVDVVDLNQHGAVDGELVVAAVGLDLEFGLGAGFCIATPYAASTVADADADHSAAGLATCSDAGRTSPAEQHRYQQQRPKLAYRSNAPTAVAAAS